MERLTEGLRLINQLWESAEPFRFEGKYFSSDFYFLYTKPSRKIPVYCSAIGRKAAHEAGVCADGLISIGPRNNVQRLRDTILPAYEEGRRLANKKGLGKVVVEVIFSFAEPSELIKSAWRMLGICRKDSWSIPNPVAAEEEGRNVTVEELRRHMYFCKNWKDLVKIVEAYQEVGVNHVTTYTGCDKKMIRAFAKNVHDVF